MGIILNRRRVMGKKEDTIPNNVIIYYAPDKLVETTNRYSEGLHTNAFNTTIISHTFSDGVGTIVFADDVTELKHSAFRISKLTGVILPNSVTITGDSMFYKSTIEWIKLPDSIVSMGAYSFGGCVKLKRINIPPKLTSIPSNFTTGCLFTYIAIPEGVQTIGDNAFDSTKLTSVIIPSSVISLGNGAFVGCGSLNEIECKPLVAPNISSTAFRYIGRNGTLKVPLNSTGYDVWMDTTAYYLGYYNWTKIEQ